MSLRPLARLTVLMRRIDLLRPGERLAVGGAIELKLVLVARPAGELYDEVGQGLTA